MDEDNCMVDVARYFVEFTNSESCGKCVPCRVGLNKSLRILNRITTGGGRMQHMETLDELSRYIRDCSLCGLGQTAPNPVLTTMRHFRHEFEDHIVARRCQAGVCTELALSPCENSCPLHMNIPRFLQLYKEERLEEAFDSVILDNPLPASTGRVCQHPCDERCRRQTMDDSVNMREVHRFIADSVLLSDRFEAAAERARQAHAGAHRAQDRHRGRRTGRTDRRVLPGAAGTRRHGVRSAAGSRGHAALCAAGISPAQAGAAARDRTDRAPGREVRAQHARRHRHLAQRTGRALRCRVPGHRDLERVVGLSAGNGAEGRLSGAAVAGVDCQRRLGESWAQGGGDRRRQRGHRFGANRRCARAPR